LAKAVVADPNLLSDADRRFVADDQALLADVLAGQAYVEALVPIGTKRGDAR
jgi:hypothetical protein